MPLRLIQVGLGGWGLDWTGIVKRSAEVSLVGVVDLDPAPLALARERHALPKHVCFAGLEEAFAATPADAVLVTAGPSAHAPLALAALGAGKHVLLEKPFAPTVKEAETVVQAARDHGRVLMVSQNYRFFPAVQAVTDLVRGGALGEVGSVYVDFRFDMQKRLPAGHRYFAQPEPLLTDMAIHHFDLMRAVLGQEPVNVACQSWNPPWSRFAEPAVAAAVVRFERGTVATYRGSWLGGPDTNWAGAWRLEGEGGVVTWTSRNGRDLEGERVTLHLEDEPARQVALPTVRYPGRSGSLRAFVEAVGEGKEPVYSGRDNLGSVALMAAAVASAKAWPTTLPVASPPGA